jgi:hypothetical protein
VIRVLVHINPVRPNWIEDNNVEHGRAVWILHDEVETSFLAILRVHFRHHPFPPYA